jgi:hypothetical protein
VPAHDRLCGGAGRGHRAGAAHPRRVGRAGQRRA